MNLLVPILLSLKIQTALSFFRDETPVTFRPPALKFGGPAIADLDGNGYPDLILGYHGFAPVQVFFNFDGQFERSPFASGGDMHSYVPFRARARDRTMSFTISRGARRGTFPRSPIMFTVNPRNREISNVTDESGVTVRRGRGRSAIYVDMSLNPNRSRPDVIYTNSDIAKCPVCEDSPQHAFVNLGKAGFAPILIPGISESRNNLGTVIDIDGDGIMEIILFSPGFEIFKLVAPRTVRDITNEVLPGSLADFVVSQRITSIAEFDFDNDGDFDLYIAVGKTLRRLSRRGLRGNDILLENRGGVFVDVSERAGIPQGTFSVGVTTGDFDNNGFMDIFLTLFDEPDVMLLNNGNGTFTRVENLIDRAEISRGDMAQAVDYDADGMLDLIVSQGDRNSLEHLGTYRVMKNIFPRRRTGFILVRVGSSPRRRAVSLHAVVTVTARRRIWVRRVGTPGVAMSASYIELIHVGIARVRIVDVTVRWVNGEEAVVENVARGSVIEVGTFGGCGRRFTGCTTNVTI